MKGDNPIRRFPSSATSAQASQEQPVYSQFFIQLSPPVPRLYPLCYCIYSSVNYLCTFPPFIMLQILFLCAVRLPPPPNFGDHSFGLLIVGRLPARITARRYHISKIVQYLRRSNQIQGIYEIIPQGRQPHKRRN